jgi:glycosyltransferase involved in cell wall biosynthesis
VTAQHLAFALRDRFEPRLFLLFGGEGPRPGGVPPIEISEGVRETGPFARLRSGRSLGRRIREWSPDVVVVHGGDPLRAAIIGGVHREAPLLFRRISPVPPEYLTRIRVRSLQFAYGRVSSFVAVSRSLRRELVDVFALPEDRVSVIPPGRPAPAPLFEAERKEIRGELGVGDGFLALWVGRLAPEKDPLAALDIAEGLGDGWPEFVLAMVGGGPLEDEARRRAAGLANVRVLGDRPDAVRLMQASDVLVSTSRTEGAPSTFVEALLAGLPVITPDIGGVREIVHHTENGLVVPAGDPDGIADALRAMASQQGARARLASGTRASADDFEIGAIAARYAELLESLLRPVGDRGTD